MKSRLTLWMTMTAFGLVGCPRPPGSAETAPSVSVQVNERPQVEAHWVRFEEAERSYTESTNEALSDLHGRVDRLDADSFGQARYLAESEAEELGFVVDIEHCGKSTSRTHWKVIELPSEEQTLKTGAVIRRLRRLRMKWKQTTYRDESILLIEYEIHDGESTRHPSGLVTDRWFDAYGTLKHEADLIIEFLNRLDGEIAETSAQFESLDARLEILRHKPPRFPRAARKHRITQRVTVQLLIDRDGAVTETKWLRGDPVFQKNTLRALRKWRWKPARRNGEPIPVRYRVHVCFKS